MIDKSLSYLSKLVFVYIWAFKDDHMYSEKTVGEICWGLGLSLNTVKKYLDELTKNNLIECKEIYNIQGNLARKIYKLKEVSSEANTEKNKSKSTHSRYSECELSSQFKQLWDLYPRKQGKKVAFEKFKKVINNGSATFEQIKDGISKYSEFAKNKDPKFVLMGSTFFTQERWQDQFENDQQGSWYEMKLKELKKDYIDIDLEETENGNQ